MLKNTVFECAPEMPHPLPLLCVSTHY